MAAIIVSFDHRVPHSCMPVVAVAAAAAMFAVLSVPTEPMLTRKKTTQRSK